MQNELTTQNLIKMLQAELWDLHKVVTGYHPRWWTEAQWNDIDFLLDQQCNLIEQLVD